MDERAVVERDEVFFFDEAGEDDVVFEFEGEGLFFEFGGVHGVGAAGDDQAAVVAVIVFEDVKRLQKIGEIFMAAPDAGVEEIWLGEAVFLAYGFDISLIDLIVNRMEFFVNAFVNHRDFFVGNFENILEIFFGVLRDGDDLFGFRDRGSDGDVVSETVHRRSHFPAGIK